MNPWWYDLIIVGLLAFSTYSATLLGAASERYQHENTERLRPAIAVLKIVTIGTLVGLIFMIF